MNTSIRIIGGLYRGKKIPVPELPGLRPTPNRIRETLFNWLMQDIRGAICLDAFAGSGALGLEAFSRGAAQVTFLEQAPLAYASLKSVLTTFNSTQLQLIQIDACHYFTNTGPAYNLIFLDPPFNEQLLPQCLTDLANSRLLAPGGLVYLESANWPSIDLNVWTPLKEKKAGQVLYGLLKKL